MDPTIYYHLGQIVQRELLEEAEKHRRLDDYQEKPSLWARFTARLNQAAARRSMARDAEAGICSDSAAVRV